MKRAGRGLRRGITVIGTGNWGSSLVKGVLGSGMPLAEVVVRDEGKAAGEIACVTFERAVFDAELLWLCVPDGTIVGVATEIAARRGDLTGQTVVHSSGALTVEVLEAVKLAGARVGGIAPVLSFPTREPVPLDGVLFAVESAADAAPALRTRLNEVVRRLGGTPLRISPETKALYHAAATMASPLLVSALEAAVTTAKRAGLEQGEAEAVVGVLARATVANYYSKGVERSFSGAFARGDAGTVELHLRALLAHPILHDVYLALTRNAVDCLPVRNREEFTRLLDGPGR